LAKRRFYYHKWDWEGKLVDESVIERMFSTQYEFFQKHPLGTDKFLTFRLPNPRVETEFRLGRAFMSLLSAAGLAKQINLPTPPLFEVILPMTETAEEIIEIQKAFAELASLKHPLYRFDKDGLTYLALIPLFEDIYTIADSAEILRTYLKLHQKAFGFTPTYLRPYIARSDPAMNAGLVPAVLAAKIALSSYRQLEKDTGVAMYPIIGVAALPFRGGLRPDTIEQFVKEYSGIRTTLIQSAFRYDFPKEQVIRGIQQLEDLLPKSKTVTISAADEKGLRSLLPIFADFYKELIPDIAADVNAVAHQLPKRRERVQHVGLFGYSRGEGGVKLPRAIGFTAALYSLGVPPEIFGTGRGLMAAKKLGKLPLIEKYYLNLRDDLTRTSRYVDTAYIQKRAKTSKTWQKLAEDVQGMEEYLGFKLGPVTETEQAHFKLVKKIQAGYRGKKPMTSTILKAAILRQSLG
jgi:phosphoenolpyruvate carboxylase